MHRRLPLQTQMRFPRVRVPLALLVVSVVLSCTEVPTALLTRLEAPPVVGAVLMALEQRGSRPTSEVHDRIGRSLVTAFR